MAENINKNFLNSDWWAKATVDDVEAEIAKGADINSRDIHGATALMWASGDNENLEIIETLIKLGADIEIQDNYGRTPLLEAASCNINPSGIIKLLANLGANIHHKDNKGKTALMCIINNENPDIQERNLNNAVKTLIDLGVDVNMKDNEGKTALDYAKEKDDKEIIDILIELGAK